MIIDAGAVTYAQLDAYLRRYRRLVVCTVIRSQGSVPRRVGARMVVLPNGSTHGTIGGGLFEALARDEALLALESGRSRAKNYDFRPKNESPDAFGAICGGRAELFFEVATMPEPLLIVGGGHCGRALARIASLLGRFAITLVDDRDLDHETPELPEAVHRLRIERSFDELPAMVDPETCIVLVTQGAETDERALRQVIGCESRYLGMMGSRKKVRTVFDNLRRDGFGDEQLARVHAPIGLEIHSETPEEIAISILAQIIQIRGSELTTRQKPEGARRDD